MSRKNRDKNFAWNLLRRLGQGCNYPWLVGDFNEIMYSFEKSSGVPREQKRMEEFRDTLEECQLMDIGYSGAWFTWERGNLPETNIRERLDRMICLKKWACFNKSKKDGLKKRLTKELEILLKKERDDEMMARIIDTKIHLNMEIDKDEMYWEQRAKANWLQLGDNNTAYFHKCATVRRPANLVTKLVSDDGKEITDG
ncbi:reverse transcriptase [Gossypium australe]|uniref:Reverse transcriptase n=1 Tax=Gossypium australe TaxID=47621 RepID=A0A5B6VCI6_9ROSI|nr:reverse transcriptase [Gossypium australe]